MPAAQAVRDRVAMLGRLLDTLPAGARVLNPACGPALEAQHLFAARPDKQLVVDLVDHDLHTLAYLRVGFPGSECGYWPATPTGSWSGT